MATTALLQITRGSGATRLFKLPIASYVTGSTLRFTAKLVPDNDLSDAAAVINKEFTDANVDIISDPKYAIYTMNFAPSDTVAINFDTASSQTQIAYVGQFKFKTPGGQPVYYPDGGKYINVLINADVPRETP